MVDFPIVDTHLHVWDPAHLDYPWLEGIPFLNRPFLPKDYKKAFGAIEVEKIVFVQAAARSSQFREEAAWVTVLAKEDPRIEGIVAWAPLEQGAAVREDLETLAQNGLVKGIRRIIQFEDDIEFCLQPSFVEGVRALPDYGLTFDICISHIQMANTIRLVEQCPDVQFVLDHIGKPDIKNHVLEPWRQELSRLAEFPNVWCKVSGLVTEADYASWTRDDLKPYIEHVVASFGFDRVMYGGDWPVAYQAAAYPEWVHALAWAVSGCTQSELRKLFRDSAVSFYRLD